MGFLDHISDVDLFLTAKTVEMHLVSPHIEGATLVATVDQDNQLLETEMLSRIVPVPCPLVT